MPGNSSGTHPYWRVLRLHTTPACNAATRLSLLARKGIQPATQRPSSALERRWHLIIVNSL